MQQQTVQKKCYMLLQLQMLSEQHKHKQSQSSTRGTYNSILSVMFGLFTGPTGGSTSKLSWRSTKACNRNNNRDVTLSDTMCDKP